MKIRMKETRSGFNDGYTVERNMQGETYDMPRTLAVYFLNQGWAEAV